MQTTFHYIASSLSQEQRGLQFSSPPAHGRICTCHSALPTPYKKVAIHSPKLVPTFDLNQTNDVGGCHRVSVYKLLLTGNMKILPKFCLFHRGC